MLSVEEVERAIAQFPPNDQRRLLTELPWLLKFAAADFASLKLSESSFHFWENPDDAIYDTL